MWQIIRKLISFVAEEVGHTDFVKQGFVFLPELILPYNEKKHIDTTNRDNRFVEANIKKFTVEYFENGFFTKKDDNRLILMNNVSKEITVAYLPYYQIVSAMKQKLIVEKIKGYCYPYNKEVMILMV